MRRDGWGRVDMMFGARDSMLVRYTTWQRSISLLKCVAETGAVPDLTALSNCSRSPSRRRSDSVDSRHLRPPWPGGSLPRHLNALWKKRNESDGNCGSRFWCERTVTL